MGFWEHFPYTNFHDINLNWIISKLGEINSAIIVTDQNKEASANNAASAENFASNAERSASMAEQKVEECEALAEQKVEECEALVNEAKYLYEHVGMQRRFILIGDSYGVDTVRDDEAITGWCSRVKNMLGFNDFLCATYPKSGAGFVAGGAAGDFKSCLNESAEFVETPESITDVVVLGGYNDWNYTIAEIQTNIDAFQQRAKELYPNAVVTIGYIGRRSKQATLEIWSKFIDAYKAYSQSGASYMNNIQYACRDKSFFVSDGVHPNNTGEERIAKAVVSWIRGGYNAFDRGAITIGDLSGVLAMDNGCTTITLPSITLSGAQTASIDMGLVNVGWVLCTPLPTALILTGSVKNVDDNTWHNCQFYASFNEYCHLILRPRCVISNGFLAPEKFASVSVPAQTVTIPTMVC